MRKKGKSLANQNYQYKTISIYRAVLATITEFKPMDYVTLSQKWAIEHCQHIIATEEEPAHVLYAHVKTQDVYDAYNPGEYFYDGPPIPAKKIIYKSTPEQLEMEFESFKTWLENQELIGRKLPTNQPLQITSINQEEDWEIADQIDNIAKKTNIRPNSNKEVVLVAQVGEEIIGGIYAATYEEEHGRTYDFDIVVNPQWQGYQNVGLKLINAAIQDAKSNDCQTIQAHVVNPRLAVILANKYGFDGMPHHWDGKTPIHNYSTILTRQI